MPFLHEEIKPSKKKHKHTEHLPHTLFGDGGSICFSDISDSFKQAVKV